MKAIIKGKRDWKVWGLKAGDEVNIREIGYDDIFKEKIYWIIGKSFFLPESDLKIL